jgi:hypothetical protein
MRLFVAILLVGGCVPVAPTSEAPCAQACENMERLGCEEAQPDEEGATCVQVCEAVEEGGEFSLNPECRAEKTSCEAMTECDEN